MCVAFADVAGSSEGCRFSKHKKKKTIGVLKTSPVVLSLTIYLSITNKRAGIRGAVRQAKYCVKI